MALFVLGGSSSNKDAICNAIPLEQMSYKQLLLDHSEASPDEINK